MSTTPGDHRERDGNDETRRLANAVGLALYAGGTRATVTGPISSGPVRPDQPSSGGRGVRPAGRVPGDHVDDDTDHQAAE